MYILDVSSTCSSPGLANVLSIIKTGLNIIQIIGPIIAIIGITMNIIKLMTNPDDKKAKPALRNSIIALVVLFMTPFIVNLIMYQFDDTFDLAKCWTDAENAKKEIDGDNYIPTNKKPPTTSFKPNATDYETEPPEE